MLRILKSGSVGSSFSSTLGVRMYGGSVFRVA
jgi:hypothetical protein